VDGTSQPFEHQWFVIHEENSRFVATTVLQTSALLHSGPSFSPVALHWQLQRVPISVSNQNLSDTSEGNAMTDTQPCAQYPSFIGNTRRYFREPGLSERRNLAEVTRRR